MKISKMIAKEPKKVFEKVMENIEKKNIISAMPIKLGGVLEAAFKMGLGNRVGFEIEAKDIFSPMPGSILIEAREEISEEDFILLGKTNLNSFKINGIDYSFDEAQDLLTKTLKKIYPIYIEEDKKALDIKTKSPKNNFKYKENVDKPKVLIPVFPGTNSEYDTKKAFEREGFEVEVFVLNNLSKENLLESVDKLSKKIEACHILTLVGGFSMGDEPDGSAKFIANVLSNEKIKESIRKHLEDKKLILGICNGFQALVKSGLLPYSKLGEKDGKVTTLFRNNIGRHVSKIVSTRYEGANSPWLSGFKEGEVFETIVSHGEGKFQTDSDTLRDIEERGLVAFRYVDSHNNPTMNGRFNPNSSLNAIEGLVSEDGLILGKMGHSERYEEDLLKNIPGNKMQNIFKNAKEYFSK